MFHRIIATAAFCLSAVPAFAQCEGENLMTQLPAAQMASLTDAANAVPYPSGNFWRATRDDQVLHIIGTYHLDDPRLPASMARLEPLIAGAATVLVEAGPDEEKKLMDHMGKDPSVMIITKGPTLPEMLPEADWNALSDAMRTRGIPPFMAAKFQPWYIALMLGIPPCAMTGITEAKGLDGRIIEAAEAASVPVLALEPYDTVLGIFDILTPDEQMSMIRSTLAMEGRSEDFSVTLADTYFAEESRLIWEFMRLQTADLPGYTPEKIEVEFARMEEAMMASRNRKWIPVIEKAASNGPAVVAFGALHLSGREGVLALLEKQGFTLERLPLK